jgi:hypothetical protein
MTSKGVRHVELSKNSSILPALFVDRGDGGGAELHQIGQQDDLALVFGIPSDDASQQVRIVGLGLGTGEADELVGADVPVLRDHAFLDHLKGGVVLQAGDKENPAHTPAAEQGVVDIAAVDGHNRAGIQPEGIGQLNVAPFGFGEQHVGRQVVVVVQQDVGLNAAFGTAELGPRKHR